VATAAGRRRRSVTMKYNVTGLPARHGETFYFRFLRQVAKGVQPIREVSSSNVRSVDASEPARRRGNGRCGRRLIARGAVVRAHPGLVGKWYSREVSVSRASWASLSTGRHGTRSRPAWTSARRITFISGIREFFLERGIARF